MVRQLFNDNPEYFHILPQLFLQHTYIHSLKGNRPIQDVELDIAGTAKRLLFKLFMESKLKGDALFQERNLDNLPFVHFNPNKSLSSPPNSFPEAFFPEDYQQLTKELLMLSDKAREHYKEFKSLVDLVRKRAHGIPYGV